MWGELTLIILQKTRYKVLVVSKYCKTTNSGGSRGYAPSKEEGERVIKRSLSNLIFST